MKKNPEKDHIEKDLIEKLAPMVGLLVGHGALERENNGRYKFKTSRVSTQGGDPRVTRVGSISGGPLCTGALVRLRTQNGPNVACVLTAGHCIVLDLSWVKGACLVTGLTNVEDSFDETNVHSLNSVVHYETERERDLAIATTPDVVSQDRVLLPPPERLDDFSGCDKLYVVGHNGGHALKIFPATFESRVPRGPARLRGLNLVVEPRLGCLSGAPVVRVIGDKEPQLLGVIKGPGTQYEFSRPPEQALRELVAEHLAMDGAAFLDLVDVIGEHAGDSPETLVAHLRARRLGLAALEFDKLLALGGSCTSAVSTAYMTFLGGSLASSFY